MLRFFNWLYSHLLFLPRAFLSITLLDLSCFLAAVITNAFALQCAEASKDISSKSTSYTMALNGMGKGAGNVILSLIDDRSAIFAFLARS